MLIRTLLIAAAPTTAASAQTKKKPTESYPLHLDSKQHEGVPAGEVIAGVFDQSGIFPGTTRDYWVYVPEQHDKTKPACLMVFQDGRNYMNRERAFRGPNVFDNLIHKGDMPVTIGLFINHAPAGSGRRAPCRGESLSRMRPIRGTCLSWYCGSRR